MSADAGAEGAAASQKGRQAGPEGVRQGGRRILRKFGGSFLLVSIKIRMDQIHDICMTSILKQEDEDVNLSDGFKFYLN